jgi:hypothetical protein
VKDARTEAQKEIEEYRSQKESEFKSFEKEVNQHYFDIQSVVLARTKAYIKVAFER